VQHATIKRSRHNEQALQRMRFIDALNLCDANATVHRAAANDIDFRNRATRGSVCNGLFCLFSS
jgi:hypothetical protein